MAYREPVGAGSVRRILDFASLLGSGSTGATTRNLSDCKVKRRFDILHGNESPWPFATHAGLDLMAVSYLERDWRDLVTGCGGSKATPQESSNTSETRDPGARCQVATATRREFRYSEIRQCVVLRAVSQ
jgi:hypothetical protein